MSIYTVLIPWVFVPMAWNDDRVLQALCRSHAGFEASVNKFRGDDDVRYAEPFYERDSSLH